MQEKKEAKKCFVIMPISDHSDYEPGHFNRVYEYIIRPACLKAGFDPLRADEVQRTNYIVIDILKHIISSDLVICDLSSRNPNVLYELGIRQAFSLPVTLIRDSITPRIFDIQGLRDIDYDVSLRIDTVTEAVDKIASTLTNTFEDGSEDVNSVIQLLGVNPAKVSETKISEESKLLLNAIDTLGDRLSFMERKFSNSNESSIRVIRNSQLPLYETVESEKNTFDHKYSIGDIIRHQKWGDGEVIESQNDEIKIKFGNSIKRLVPKYAPIILVKSSESA